MQWLESKCDQMQKELTHLKTELNALKAQMKKSEKVKTKKRSSKPSSKPLKKLFEEQRDHSLLCFLCKKEPRCNKNNSSCVNCLKTPLSPRRCIVINETGKNVGKQCGYPHVEGRKKCRKHLEDFIDVTKSEDSDDESSEDDENESIVVTDHSSDGSLSDSEEEYCYDESSSSDSEDDRPLKRQRR